MTKILVIEDEAMLREEVTDWLTFEGYEALDAEDGLVGVAIATAELPALIICDITMPRLNGYGVLLEMRSNAATAQIPFIFMTARAAHEDVRQGMSLGADDYITKPFTRLELFQAIQTRLEKKAAQQVNQQHQIDALQRALEQEHETRLLKVRLVAMFSHDFRNPLSAILSSNSLLRDYGDRLSPAHRLDHMNRVEASARQLLQMLDDMLVVARMETGSLNPEPEPLKAGEFIQSIVDEFRTMHGDTIRVEYECDFPHTLMVDPRLLRQIAANLISNAIKYSTPGSGVRVALDSQESQCILTVEDHGIGIPEVDQIRLFQSFQRGSNVGKVSGTGLGLAIVKQAADLMDGSIELKSHVGIGTTVVATFPFIEPTTEG